MADPDRQEQSEQPNGNPLAPSESLVSSAQTQADAKVHPQSDVKPEDSATTKAEKVERHGHSADGSDEFEESASKRVKLEHDPALKAAEPSHPPAQPERQKGVTPIKKEFLVDVSKTAQPNAHADDDDAEASGRAQDQPTGGRGGQKTQGGQNKARQFGKSKDEIELCKSRCTVNESTPQTCQYGDKCKFTHDIRKYLSEGKRGDLATFNGQCPRWEVRGRCGAGWKCRFAGSHSKEVEHENGSKELVLIEDTSKLSETDQKPDEEGVGVTNIVSQSDKFTLRKKKFPAKKSDEYIQWIDKLSNTKDGKARKADEAEESRATYKEPPFMASEKRRIYYGPETPVLAPLTTQGNLPFRRLAVSLGAEITWSEMAMGFPLMQGERAEWALMKAHESELSPPKYTPKNVVHDYDNSKDIKFGAQIAANKPWIACKTTEILTALCPSLRAIDLNCGCPIDLVFRQGAGSALLDAPTKMARLLTGMNAVSGEVPITVKIRMGTKDKSPNADKICKRLIMGHDEPKDVSDGPAGVAAITLHGRSRQQRYTRSADWSYIASTANLVESLRDQRAAVTDTVREPDARDLSASTKSDGMPYFIGNGDVLSHVDYNKDMEESKVDSCMIARGALIKPWIFEEIATNQYLDKSAEERLGYIEQFVRNGLEYWGSDEIGVGNTRRFLLEWLSFSCRYVPIGLLEHLPPKFGDRPPAFRGRSELETLLSSANYKDWIKISEMFLGPAHKDFNFQPKHKSNSYEIEAEG